ncbi:swm1p [Saccharomyces arboricola H-6]|uniref:Swm1p n=1 Tax=Saccharomyces arboricola (strain H-6 / AS 2.3317 / CBS 10644) TaxID=1160507 RepID=J8PY25_SACAR|nr:swm1p [Saccharomyces arboricola H-6]
MSSSSYRDSYFQYRHLLTSHHILYAEWNQDILALPDEIANVAMAMGDNTRPDAGEGRATQDGERNTSVREGSQSKTLVSKEQNSNRYWDSFHDEDDWNLFNGMELESNGVVIFAGHAFDHSVNGGANSGNDGANEPRKETVTGSIFDRRITQLAYARNNGWHELALPRSR